MGSINSRLHALEAKQASKPYSRQKSKLQQELETFLASLPLPKSLISASPEDLIRFLIWKDRCGKTIIHTPQCRYFGQKKPPKSTFSCSCPSRLAAGTVDSYIGKLRAIFQSFDQHQSTMQPSSNPAAHPSLKRYLHAIKEEQAQARVTPRQAKPLFFDKFSTLSAYLRNLALSPDTSPIDRYLHSRDLAFFSIDFYSGDRASDLGRIYTKEILLLPDGDGYLFHHTFGKTLRGGNSNIFAVKACSNFQVCPVANLKLYVELADRMGIPLRQGFLFRTVTPSGTVSPKPFVGSAVAARLHLHLNALQLDDGETMHSFRAGCSITLSLLGATDQDIARHVGWRNLSTAQYYTQTNKVMALTKPANLLRDGTSAMASQSETPPALTLGREFRRNNSMVDFTVAFPTLL